MSNLGLWSESLQCWASSLGKPVRYWGDEQAQAGLMQWLNAGLHLGADWEIREIE